MSTEYLERRFPAIEWREPAPIRLPAGEFFGCRFCISRRGFSTARLDDALKRGTLHRTREKARAHIAAEHDG